MATLKSKHKKFIITRLACFDAPSEIAEEFEEYFDFEVPLNQISYYNPGNLQGRDLAAKWKDLFTEVRERFLEEVQHTPIAHKAYRLRKLQQIFEKFERMANYKAANETLEQAAKEMGGWFTNKKLLDLNGLMSSINLDRLTDQQLERIANGEHPIAVLTNDSTSETGDPS